MKLPIQPLYRDDSEVIRFRPNALVRYLLDNGGIDLNQLATVPCSPAEREQFAQLIGYSLDGWGTLNYVRDKTWKRAKRKARKVNP